MRGNYLRKYVNRNKGKFLVTGGPRYGRIPKLAFLPLTYKYITYMRESMLPSQETEGLPILKYIFLD